MAGLLDLEEERRKNLAPTNPRSIAGLLATVGENPNAQMMSMAQDYARNLPQKLATNQAALDRAIGGWNKTDFATGQANPNYYPEAINELTQIMPNMAGMIAYHGTPHNILGKFDISKVGTGEGAQAYGHGMYFAENPAVATDYANKLGYDYKYMGKTPKEDSPTDLALRWLKNLDWDKEAAKAQWKNEGLGAKVIQAIDKINLEKVQKPGNLYKVDIPDEYIPNMMDYYKPLSEQPKVVQDIAWQYKDALKKQTEFKGAKSIWDLDGGDLYGVMQRYQINDAGKLIKKNVDAKDVSNKLLNAGIPGIKYLDQGSLQQTDSYLAKHGGTSNFVVFEPSTVKILEKNKKKVEGLLD